MEPQFHNIDLHNLDFLYEKYNLAKKSKNGTDTERKYSKTADSLIEKTKVHCRQLIEHSRCSKLPFHNWQHTVNVVRNAHEIGAAKKIDNSSLEFLVIAAYFHDVGHVNGTKNHERKSCEYLMDFLGENGYQQDYIEVIQGIILATVMPQIPNTELQKVICDADLAHLGKTSFWIQNERLRKEWSGYCHKVFSNRQWVELNIKFLECHDFKTQYAKDRFGERKNRNIAQLKVQLKGLISIDQ